MSSVGGWGDKVKCNGDAIGIPMCVAGSTGRSAGNVAGELGQDFVRQGECDRLPAGAASHAALVAADGRMAQVAQVEAALAQYRQVIIQAFREVTDGLVEYRKRQEARLQQEALTLASRGTTRLANIRYRGGVTSYLEVLDSERELFDAELGLARSRRDELIAIVRIYKALGGGWQE